MSEQTKVRHKVGFAYEGGVAPDHHDGPFMLILEHESTGALYFGPFRSYAAAEKAAARSERITGEPFWSIEALQPGSYLPEWSRIAVEDSA